MTNCMMTRGKAKIPADVNIIQLHQIIRAQTGGEMHVNARCKAMLCAFVCIGTREHI